MIWISKCLMIYFEISTCNKVLMRLGTHIKSWRFMYNFFLESEVFVPGLKEKSKKSSRISDSYYSFSYH